MLCPNLCPSSALLLCPGPGRVDWCPRASVRASSLLHLQIEMLITSLRAPQTQPEAVFYQLSESPPAQAMDTCSQPLYT